MSVVTQRIPHCVLLFTCAAILGCQQSDSPSSTEPAAPAKQAEPATPAASPTETSAVDEPDVTVEVRSWAEVQQLVADQKGKVVVVDIWSTWCVPCMREFPHLVELHKQYSDRVVCISVDIDYIGLEDEPPESHRDRVLEFLKKHGATFSNVISSDPDVEVLKKVDAGSVPAVLVYDREGKLEKKFTNDDNEFGDKGFSYTEHITPMIEKLLKE
jgi:thiol-disulfide isomerase/thioredoxin